jgi:DNA primase
VELAVAVLPEGLDPCDLLSEEGGVEVFNTVLGSAVDALDFKMNRLLERDPNPSVQGQQRILDSVLGVMTAAPALKSQSSQVKQELIVTRLSHRLGLRQETVWARFGELARDRKQRDQQQTDRRAAAPPAPEPDAPEEQPIPVVGARFEAEKQVLNLLLAYPEFVAQAVPAISPEEIGHTGLRRLLAELYSIHAEDQTPDMDILRERLHDRPDLYEAAEKRRYVGQHMTEPEQQLAAILGWFARQKSQAEEKSLTAKLKGGPLDHDEAAELLRKLQQRRT